MRRKRNHYRTKRGWKCRLPGKKEAMILQMRTGAGEDVEKKMNEENTVLTRKKKICVDVCWALMDYFVKAEA